MEGKFWRSSRQNPPGVDATDSGLSHPGKSIWRPEHRDEGPVTSGHGIFGATTSLSQRGAQPLQVGDAVGQRVEGKNTRGHTHGRRLRLSWQKVQEPVA